MSFTAVIPYVSVYGPAAAPIVWNNLNVSAATGAQTVLVFLKIETQGAGANPRIAVRQGGVVDQFYDATQGPHGATRARIGIGNESMLLAVKTSATGIVEWIASAATNVEVLVVGYCTITEDATAIFSGTVQPSWVEQDISTVIGERAMFTVLEWYRTGGTANNIAVRPGDDTSDFLVVDPNVGGPHMDGRAGANIYSNLLVHTDSNGTFDLACEAVAPAGVLSMSAFCPITEPTSGAEVFPAAAPPVAWTVLDLTPAGVPAGRVLAVLRIHQAAAAGARTVAVRAADDAGDYMSTMVGDACGCACADLNNDLYTILVCPTSNGQIDWIVSAAGINFDVTVLGWVAAPASPTVSAQNPIYNEWESDFQVRAVITDEDGIDTTTIGLTATDPVGVVTNIITAGVFDTGWSGYIASTGIGDREITIVANQDEAGTLASGKLWTFSLAATSYGGGTL